MEKIKEFILGNKVELIVLLIAFLFSWWLMFSTFSYSSGEIRVASKAWSDFGSHIPLIRSFSFGDNFPPEYPLFSGPPIKYHFLFYAFVGTLERIGIPLDYALNLPSLFGFTFLIFMIYLFSKEIFKSKGAGILSIIFFLFNGSLEFIKFFSENITSGNIFSTIINNRNFVSFGPYDGSIISAFWNLNIYTNQRHLALSYAFSLLIIYIFLKLKDDQKKNIKISMSLGIILGISFLLNMAVFLMTAIVLCSFLIFLEKKRIFVFISLAIGGLISFPIYYFMQSGGTSNIALYTGYLITNPSLSSFVNYWVQNLGLHIFLIPLGFALSSKINKKIFISFLIIFAIGNLVKFSPEIAANHKFFNYFMIIGVMFSSYFLVTLWQKKHLFKPFVIIAVFFLIISGILDFFPILNDNKIVIRDYPHNKDVAWIINNTNPDSVFLNTQFTYDNASLAGRKIFLGWPYFPWSQGYNTDMRFQLMTQMLGSTDKTSLCVLLKNNNVDYIEISKNSLSDPNLPKVSNIYFEEFNTIYKSPDDNYYIYSVLDNCKNI